ncbi:MAG: sulfotransferase [Polyangiales bacterium]
MRLPFPYNVVTFVGDPISPALLRFDVEPAMRWAERTTGLSDYGDDADEFRQRVHETVQAANAVDWNTMGRFGVRYILHWHLSNRLKIVEALKQFPQIAEVPVRRPLIITGLFRTGTTYLHNVLAADPRNRAAKMWELCYPVGRKHDPLGDAKWRRQRGSWAASMNHSFIPDQAEAHLVTADAYEEDFFLLENDFSNLKLCVGLGDYDYAMQMLERDMGSAYRLHKLQLQMLWLQQSAERWLLKAPWHLWEPRCIAGRIPRRIDHPHASRFGRCDRFPMQLVGSNRGEVPK